MGPSFHPADVEYFSGFYTFACNKIFLALEETSWRPDYYLVTDKLVAENNRERINSGILGGAERLYPEQVYRVLGEFGDPTVFSWKHHLGEQSESRFRETPFEGLLGPGRTVLFDMMQLAFLMGFDEVYTVGLDFSFDLPSTASTRDVESDRLVSEGERNHFHPDYRPKGETWTVPKMDEMRAAFEYAAQAYSQANRSLINASRETKLDVIERRPFSEVF